MEEIQHARNLYASYPSQKPFLKDAQKTAIKNQIHQDITIAVRELPPKKLFENIWMLDILKSALKQVTDVLDIQAIVRAYKELEKYFLHLVEQPWKTEFKEIKMYGGFYRTRIKAVIPDCEHIFERAGYMVLPDKCIMIYRSEINKDFLLLLALDCRVSHMECKAIEEQYSKVKGLSWSLKEVISGILSDEYALDVPALRNSVSAKYGLTEENFNAGAPPSLPQRRPMISGSVLKQNVKLEKEMSDTRSNEKPDLAAIRPVAIFPPRPHQWKPSLSSSVPPKSLMSTGVMPESFVDIGSVKDEIIPELPQGTCEDHMRETLKLVNRQHRLGQPVSEDWKLDNQNITGLNQSKVLTTNPYSVKGLHSRTSAAQTNYIPASFIDEGIEYDLSTFSDSHQVLPTKHAANYYQTSLGYHTGSTGGIHYQFSPSMEYKSPQTIYHPPNTLTAAPGKVLLSRQNALPPQIPQRTLKPTPNLGVGSPNIKMNIPANSYAASQAKTLVPTTLSVAKHVALSRMSAMGQTSHEDRPIISKSSSLKTSNTDTPLSKQIAAARNARSMEMSTFWECPSCTNPNAYPSTICTVCSQIYIGPDIHRIDSSKKQVMF